MKPTGDNIAIVTDKLLQLQGKLGFPGTPEGLNLYAKVFCKQVWNKPLREIWEPAIRANRAGLSQETIDAMPPPNPPPFDLDENDIDWILGEIMAHCDRMPSIPEVHRMYKQYFPPANEKEYERAQTAYCDPHLD